ncbi:haloalkane dehalogenase [Bradyrhizobium japonicum]|uniref:Haloalkane dehalogenase n=1 Tax=Bradyrhizobium japonicum TaxID=375 RepID=A0ABV2RW09_BRAJP|nr:alpha/beta hydrolase [Bradyrhizobium japonicum]UQD95740.1 alpha/beta hydrolase [Bradyrhizobium japonicum]WLB15792.1 alpha/beta hydrolase [Bradyrhizobium japonicum]
MQGKDDAMSWTEMDGTQEQTRRAFVRDAALSAAGALAAGYPSVTSAAAGSADGSPSKAGFQERYVSRPGGRLYVRDYPGGGPPFVMLHGFPDNCRIYEELAPLLSAAGRRVIAFDFLGFGLSDKPSGFLYSFEQQLTDLKAIVDDLGGPVIPVAHDAGGPAGINFALDHPQSVSSICLLNCYYASSPALRFPELIELCSDPALKKLALAIMTDPKQAEWLLRFQQSLFEEGAPAELRARFESILQPIINENFVRAPGSGPAFLSMANDARANLEYNNRRTAALREFRAPVQLIWGIYDPYLTRAVADDMASRFSRATLKVLNANHWLQIDVPNLVAKAMLELA